MRRGDEMLEPLRLPRMTPRELAGDMGWYVEVCWPDGQEEHVGGFASMSQAQGWIDHASTDWLPQHPKCGSL